MNYVWPSAENSSGVGDISFPSASFTVSGSFGATTGSPSLSDLTAPSVYTSSYCSGSGLSPVALLEFQVCQKWISNFEPDEGAAFTATFEQMRSDGDAYITGYSAQTLREMYDRGMIRWGESEIKQDKLRHLNLPLDPGFDLSGPFQGPPIFVRQPEDGDRIAIMNGNHRTAKVLLYGAPLSASIYVLELASPEASERLLGTAPLAKYTNPRMPEAFDSTRNSTHTG